MTLSTKVILYRSCKRRMLEWHAEIPGLSSLSSYIYQGGSEDDDTSDRYKRVQWNSLKTRGNLHLQ